MLVHMLLHTLLFSNRTSTFRSEAVPSTTKVVCCLTSVYFKSTNKLDICHDNGLLKTMVYLKGLPRYNASKSIGLFDILTPVTTFLTKFVLVIGYSLARTQ